MLNFCTFFDSYYINKGLALYLSLENVSENFHMYVMAFDKECYERLSSYHLKHMTIECWDKYETGRIAEIKAERTRAEYCWSCGPSVIHHFISKHKLESITYLDSDLFFMSDPQLIFDEIGNNSVGITEQGVDNRAAQLYGRYCVQFMFFRNDKMGIEALTWWKQACLDWCYQRFEGDKYADQKYLDKFPILFRSVHVIKNLGAGVAPWNMHKYEYVQNGILYKNKKYRIIFTHMHGVKFIVKERTLHLVSYDAVINAEQKDAFFNKYAELSLTIYNTYFNKNLKSTKVSGIKGLRRVSYFFRERLRHLKVVQWLYFNTIRHEHKGHGAKIE